MRAAVFKELSKPLAIEAVADPKPGPHDIVLKVKNCGICGSDLHMTETGTIMPLPGGSVMGHEFAGEVMEVGKAVTHLWKPGDRVAGFPVICCGEHTPCINFSQRGTCAKMVSIGLGQSPGGYAEYVRIGSGSGYRLPDSVSFREGAMVEPLAVGLHAVDMAKMPRGATVLVIGAGPVGLATMLWAKFLGARHVIVSEKAEIRRQMAAKFGATDAIDPTTDDVVARVHALTGIGVDFAFEAVGKAALGSAAVWATRPGGTAVLVGAGALGDTLSIEPAVVFMATERRLIGSFLGSSNSPREIPRLLALWRAGKLDLEGMITSRRPLGEVNEAFDDLRAARGLRTVLEL